MVSIMPPDPDSKLDTPEMQGAGARLWIVSLDALDQGDAEFRHVDPSGGPSTAYFMVPRDVWESMGRPARLGLTVEVGC